MSALSEFEEAEQVDGVRMAFNVWPSTKMEQVKMVLPLGLIYTPLNRTDDMKRCPYRPLACRHETCGAILSPWCEVDTSQGIWTCPLCLTRNAFPRAVMETQRFEIEEGATTIEYEPEEEGSGSPAFLFVVDTAVKAEELEQVKASIQQALTLVPTDAMVGLITFGKHVAVHEIGFAECSKAVVFRGDPSEEKWANMNVEYVKRLLGVTPTDEKSVLRFLQRIDEIEDVFNDLIDGLTVDPWPREAKCRADRCTGMAALVGVSLLEASLQGYPARMFLFSGGPCSIGPGRIIGRSLKEKPRAHKDIVQGNAPYHDKARDFYTLVAKHAAENGHVIDLLACCLDQPGVLEQRVLVDHTGGVLVLSDTFTTDVFIQSFIDIFMTNQTEELSMCFGGEVKIRTSRQIKVNGCIGPVTAMVEKAGSSCISHSNEIGIGKTSKWSVGGLFPNTSLCFVFDVAPNQQADDVQDNGFIQFVTTYKTSYGTDVTRVTTIAVQFANAGKKDGFDLIKSGFDQEAAAVVLARWTVYKSDTEFDPDLLRWLDQRLIALCTKFGLYQKGDADSFKMPDELMNFPQFVYYLRRSQFVSHFNYSPDESAFFKACMIRENVNNVLTMIQPLLHAYTMDDEEAVPVLLELSSRHPDRVLLLDTFFHLVVWYGRNIAAWRNDKVQEDAEYKWFGEMLQAPVEECRARSEARFPYPNVIQCDEGSGQQRFLIAKLNPDNTYAQQTYSEEEQVVGDVLTDDVTLSGFMSHLRRLAVNPPQ